MDDVYVRGDPGPRYTAQAPRDRAQGDAGAVEAEKTNRIVIPDALRRRVLLGVGAIPVIVACSVGLITIWGWLTAPTARLIAEVQYSDFVWPPGFEKPPDLPMGGIDGIWFIRLRNSGSLTTAKVTLTLPSDVVFARVTKPGAKSENLVRQELVAIGDLQPQQGASVVAWTYSRPSSFSIDSIRLSHVSGIGDVVIRAPAGPFWLWMEGNWWLLIFPLGGALFMWFVVVKL